MKPRMLYFGPWDRPGHYLHDANGSKVSEYNEWGRKMLRGFPWCSSGTGIDGVLQPGTEIRFGRRHTVREVEGEALLHHRDGWTALSFWDRSVDSRGASNSTYFAEGAFTFDEMVAMAKDRFATRWKRMSFDVRQVPA